MNLDALIERAKAAPLTSKQRTALSLMARARKDDPNTDDGGLATCATFYDPEIAVAFVHHRTAAALVRRGLIEYGEHDPEWGTELRLARLDDVMQP